MLIWNDCGRKCKAPCAFTNFGVPSPFATFSGSKWFGFTSLYLGPYKTEKYLERHFSTLISPFRPKLWKSRRQTGPKKIKKTKNIDWILWPPRTLAPNSQCNSYPSVNHIRPRTLQPPCNTRNRGYRSKRYFTFGRHE